MIESTQNSHLSKVAERAKRIQFDLKVESRTLGTNAAYNFSTEDVSKSGLLLVWDRDISHMPFLENTLLELTIDPESSLLGYPVNCLGKVVRKDIATVKDKKVDVLGVQILQMDSSDMDNWEDCLSELENNCGLKLASKIPGLGADSGKKTSRSE